MVVCDTPPPPECCGTQTARTTKPQKLLCIIAQVDQQQMKREILLPLVCWGALLMLLLAAGSSQGALTTRWHQLEQQQYSFERYVREFSRTYGSEREREERQALFEQRLRSIILHNRDPSQYPDFPLLLNSLSPLSYLWSCSAEHTRWASIT